MDKEMGIMPISLSNFLKTKQERGGGKWLGLEVQIVLRQNDYTMMA